MPRISSHSCGEMYSQYVNSRRGGKLRFLDFQKPKFAFVHKENDKIIGEMCFY